MAYEPNSEAGKKALADGADPKVVEEMEAKGELHETEEPAHVEKKPDEEEAPKPSEKKDEEAESGAAGDDDEEDPLKHPNRTADSMPVWKHKEEMKKEADRIRKEAQSELEKALADAALQKGGSTSEDVTKIAEEFNLTPEVAGAMLDKMTGIVKDRLGIDNLVKDNEARKERDQQIAEKEGFESEWGTKETQAALKTIAGDRPITEEVKAKVKELAYTTTYARYRLSDVIQLNQSSVFPVAPSARRSGESGRGGTSRGAASSPKNLNEVSSEDIENMSAAEFKKFSDELGKDGSRFTRTDVPKGRS